MKMHIIFYFYVEYITDTINMCKNMLFLFHERMKVFVGFIKLYIRNNNEFYNL